MSPEFEESQFAVFFQDDLTHRNHAGIVLAPIGQVLEAQLGFDLGGWLPPSHPMWPILHVPPLPGLSRPAWNPTLSPGTAVTSKALNVFFQFKRSDYLRRSNATYFDDLGGPYWRFRADRSDNVGSLPQHELLERLAVRTKASGLVRYVAPMCHVYKELETLCDARSLLERCVYVAPARFAPDHTTCAFTSATNMIINPDPEPTTADTWADVRESLVVMMANATDIAELFESITEIAYSVGARQPERMRYPWRTPERLPSEARSLLRSYLPAAELFFRARLNWLVALTPGHER